MQVKLAVTHHTIAHTADTWQPTLDKPLTFVLDAQKPREDQEEEDAIRDRDQCKKFWLCH